MVELKTAKQMYEYCVENKLGTGTTKGWAVKHFQLLIDNLKPGEKIYSVFIGLHNFKSLTEHEGNYAYALTDKRILMAQHKLLGSNVKSIDIENVNDIGLTKRGVIGIGLSIICIDTFKEIFNVAVNVSFGENIYRCVNEAWDAVKMSKSHDQMESKNAPVEKSAVDQMKEYKELLDMGILTQEEFDKKKKEVLKF